MNQGTLIGLCGRKYSGKDEVAKALLSFDDDWNRIAFADAVRELALAIDPYVLLGPGDPVDIDGRVFVRLSELVEQIGWDVAKNGHADVRRLLQRTGTEGVRDVLGYDVWVDKAFDDAVIPLLNGGRNVVITDVRFENEIDAVQGVGGQLWRIDRPGLGPDTDHHISEIAWRKATPDYVIANDGDLGDLHSAVRRGLQHVPVAA